MTDPFSGPTELSSSRPVVGGLRGRLALFKPTDVRMVPSQLNPGQMVERMVVDVTVVDGRGPVPVVKGNPPRPTGQVLEGNFWPSVWITNQVIVDQLRDSLSSGTMVLGTIDTKRPGTDPGKGNAWGIIAPSEEDKQTARNFLAAQLVSSAAAPSPAPVPAPSQVPPSGPGSNPFA